MANSVDSLKNQRSSAKAKKRMYEKRSNGLKKICNDSCDMDDCARKINKKVDECTSELKNGIKGIDKLESKCDTIESNREGDMLSIQAKYTDAIGYLKTEKTRCDNCASNYASQISRYENQIKEEGGIIFPWE